VNILGLNAWLPDFEEGILQPVHFQNSIGSFPSWPFLYCAFLHQNCHACLFSTSLFPVRALRLLLRDP